MAGGNQYLAGSKAEQPRDPASSCSGAAFTWGHHLSTWYRESLQKPEPYKLQTTRAIIQKLKINRKYYFYFSNKLAITTLISFQGERGKATENVLMLLCSFKFATLRLLDLIRSVQENEIQNYLLYNNLFINRLQRNAHFIPTLS